MQNSETILNNLAVIQPEEKYIKSFNEAVDSVAKEKCWLSYDNGFPLEATEVFVKEIIEKNLPQIFVVDKLTDRCVGWCDALPKDEKTGYLGTGLLKEYREKGIGKVIIKKCLDLCKNFGYERVVLDMKKSNTRALHVYNSIGFIVVGESPKGYEIRGNILDEETIHMEITL